MAALNIAQGERVMLLVSRQPEWYYCMIGLIKLGVIPMPTTVLASAKDIQYRINAATASVVISVEDCDCVKKVESILGSCPSVRHKIILRAYDKFPAPLHSASKKNDWLCFHQLVAKASPRYIPSMRYPPTRANDPMIIFFTSGTTGNPKMVRHTHSTFIFFGHNILLTLPIAYPLAHYVTAFFVQDLKPSDVHWTISDTGWAKSSWGNLFGQWLVGATVVQHRQGPRFDPDAVLRIIRKFGITTFCAPPTAYRMIIAHLTSRHAMKNNNHHEDTSQELSAVLKGSSLRHCLSAGEPLNPQVIKAWKAVTGGLEIYDHYGQTETVCILANFRCREVRPGSMGLPVPGFIVDIVDDDGHPVPDMTEGHIVLKGTIPKLLF
jgi:acetyl-CoA synthetase